MENITLEKLTNKIAIFQIALTDALSKGEVRKAEDTAEEIVHTLYHYRRLTEMLTVAEK